MRVIDGRPNRFRYIKIAPASSPSPPERANPVDDKNRETCLTCPHTECLGKKCTRIGRKR